MDLLVCTGGRDYPDRKKVFTLLDALQPRSIFVGDCKTGVDDAVRSWCYSVEDGKRKGHEDFNFRVFEAHWELHGFAAGPIRNEEMIKEAVKWKTDFCRRPVLLAFPGGRGTASCVRFAMKYKILVLRSE